MLYNFRRRLVYCIEKPRYIFYKQSKLFFAVKNKKPTLSTVLRLYSKNLEKKLDFYSRSTNIVIITLVEQRHGLYTTVAVQIENFHTLAILLRQIQDVPKVKIQAILIEQKRTTDIMKIRSTVELFTVACD